MQLNSSFIAGGIAACGAVTVTHGFETVKIRYACIVPFLRFRLAYTDTDYNYRENYSRRRTRQSSIEVSYMAAVSFLKMKGLKDYCVE